MGIGDFQHLSNRRLVFQSRGLHNIAEYILPFGKRVLLLLGKNSFRNKPAYIHLQESFDTGKGKVIERSIHGEPSPEQVDSIAEEMREAEIDVVVAIGGGSVLDAGKAVSAMIGEEGSVQDYLEGVGWKKHSGAKVPFIAAPTTSGTGSEATKNAVISRIGPEGFKKSLRHDNFIPDIALIDPEATLDCPLEITASCGMDALSQLIESYLSTAATPMTDALALSGISFFARSFETVCIHAPDSIEDRAAIAYAAYLSGLTLANAGLGTIHGIAGVLGGLVPIPHGTACGTLLAEIMKKSILKLRRDNAPAGAFEKFANAGKILARREDVDHQGGCDLLIEILTKWTEELPIKKLGNFKLTPEMIDTAAKNSGNKNSPVPLSEEERKAVLMKRTW